MSCRTSTANHLSDAPRNALMQIAPPLSIMFGIFTQYSVISQTPFPGGRAEVGVVPVLD